MSLARVHLVDSDVPLKEGKDLIANCYRKVPRAAFAFTWDGNLTGVKINAVPMGTCAECIGTIPAMEGRYVYGVVPGEESLHNTDSAA